MKIILGKEHIPVSRKHMQTCKHNLRGSLAFCQWTVHKFNFNINDGLSTSFSRVYFLWCSTEAVQSRDFPLPCQFCLGRVDVFVYCGQCFVQLQQTMFVLSRYGHSFIHWALQVEFLGSFQWVQFPLLICWFVVLLVQIQTSDPYGESCAHLLSNDVILTAVQALHVVARQRPPDPHQIPVNRGNRSVTCGFFQEYKLLHQCFQIPGSGAETHRVCRVSFQLSASTTCSTYRLIITPLVCSIRCARATLVYLKLHLTRNRTEERCCVRWYSITLSTTLRMGDSTQHTVRIHQICVDTDHGKDNL